MPGWSDKYKKSINCDNPKGFSQRAHCQGKKKKVEEENNPRIPRKPGQPANSKKHSDLYTDENPKGTIHGLGFKDVATAKASVTKIRNSSRSHAHKIQAAVAMEQRAREMGKTSEAAVFRKYINTMKKKTKEMNEEKNGKCKAGYYYCYTDKKCKPIPAGFKVVGRAGMLRKENGHTVDDDSETDTKKNGNGNGSGNGNGNGGTVSEEGLRDWFGKSKSKDGKKGWVNVVTGDSCASDKPGEGIPKCVSSAKRASMSKKERLAAAAAKRREDPGQQQKSGASKPTMVKTDRKVRKEDMDINEAKDKKGKGSGTKDACYHKVKSRYSVWPSAYASGALVKCRKVGAANWGNSTKKEEYMALPEFTDVQIRAMRAAGIEVEVIDEKCWKGYEKKGMKTMFGKRYPNCVKKEEVENVKEGDGDPCWDSHKQVGMKKKGNRMVPNCVPKNEEATCMGNKKGEECPIHGKKECPTLEEATRIPPRTGNIYLISFSWRGKYMNMKLFFPEVRNPTRSEIQDALDKFYPGCNLLRFDKTVFQPSDSVLNVGVSEEVEELEEKSAAWQRKEGKNKSGGLNEKGRKSYERENPGSDLKAPSKEKGNKRRASFCARMKGMKKKLTSAKTANDPDSRINKSLRAWNC